MLVVFPAGEVSHFRWSDRARERRRMESGGRAAGRGLPRDGDAPLPVVPAYRRGRQWRARFSLPGLSHPRLRTALLGRELLNKRGRRVEVRVGRADSAREAAGDADGARTGGLSALAHVPAGQPRTIQAADVAAAAVARRRTRRTGRRAQPADRAGGRNRRPAGRCAAESLGRSGGLHRAARATFRTYSARSAGCARSRFARPARARARRSTSTNSTPTTYTSSCGTRDGRKWSALIAWRRHGCAARRRGLYTATLVPLRAIRSWTGSGPALELGRSFVRQEYQKGFAPLLLLWKGIGAYVARNPQYKILFGPVSISNQYQAVSRELMVAFLEKYAMLRDWAGLVRNGVRLTAAFSKGHGRLPERRVRHRRPLGGGRRYRRKAGRRAGPAAAVSAARRQAAGVQRRPKFANALDGLILVDLTKTEPKLLDRYLGRREAATISRISERKLWNTLEHSFGRVGHCG